MLSSEERIKISSLIKKEVIPAVGCTEPVAVALAVSKATELLGMDPLTIKVGLSGNILKNAMGVGIPGTGMIGLPIAIALGSIKRNSGLLLEVLSGVTHEEVEKGKKIIKEGIISINHLADTPSNLYIDVQVEGDNGEKARAVIGYSHTNFILLSHNGEIIMDNRMEYSKNASADDEMDIHLSLETVWDYAVNSPLEEIDFILDAEKLNSTAAHYSLKRKGLGHKVGTTIDNHIDSHFGGSVLAHMLAMTSSACDARMAGEPVTVMSNSGSGNQGIAITMPVVSYANKMNVSHEQKTRALIMAHLTSIYIKQRLGRLSALCGCVVASTGASMALVYLMGGNYNQASFSVKNMIATLTGMICDGAKPACSLKIASGVSTAYISALMAMNNQCVTSTEGIIDEDVDITIRNFADIGRDAMNETDKMVLKIMSK